MLPVTICFAVIACSSQVIGSDYREGHNQAQPYSFGYVIKDKHGEQHREESSDGSGNVKGNYGFVDEKGIRREVNYVADKGGFRAQIKTNEPGTSQQSPAGVQLTSNDPYAQGAAVPYVSRPNDPYVPALDISDGAKGFPTIYSGFDRYGSYQGYNQGGYGSNQGGYGLNQGGYGSNQRGLGLNRGYGSDYNQLGQGFSGIRGFNQGNRYFRPLAYTGLLGGGLGYGQGGVVNFGANLVGGVIRGFDTRFTNLN